MFVRKCGEMGTFLLEQVTSRNNRLYLQIVVSFHSIQVEHIAEHKKRHSKRTLQSITKTNYTIKFNILLIVWENVEKIHKRSVEADHQ